jgi:hypothetical protein
VHYRRNLPQVVIIEAPEASRLFKQSDYELDNSQPLFVIDPPQYRRPDLKHDSSFLGLENYYTTSTADAANSREKI